ncbi:MAG: hypothetical protein OEM15_10765 [Myxococcales bacterium]|nr:hypothetical protein [Myxococcales bacterium]MDH3482982.1 hypothetical protein [Myxococcales bacterium]
MGLHTKLVAASLGRRGRGPRRALWWSPLLLAAVLPQPVDCETGADPRLASLAVEVLGEDQIVGFNPSTRGYEVGTQEASMVVRAEARDPEAHVTYQHKVGHVLVGSGLMGIGGGEVTSGIPFGRSTLTIAVASEKQVFLYVVEVARGRRFPCTEDGVSDAVAFGGGPHAFDCDGPATVVTRAELVANYDVWLDGEGELTIDNGGGGRVFFVAAGATAKLEGMELTGGTADFGGALYNQGRASLTNVRIASNKAYERGGGIYSGPGSELSLDGVTIDDNTATGGGEAAGGGLYLERCTVFIRNSVVENNVARGRSGQSGRRARGGGLFVSEGALIVEASRIVANSAIGGDASGEFSGAGYSRGAGLNLEGPMALIVDSAVSGNASLGGFGPVGGGFASGGGIWFDVGSLTIEGTTIDNNLADGMTGRFEAGAGGALLLSSDARFVAVNSTISGNRADFGEAMELGLRARAAFYNSTIAFNSTDEGHSAVVIRSDSEVTLRHTVLANEGRCFGTVRSLGYNLFGPNFECNIEGDTTGDLTDVDPQLASLADNGGPTMTHAISENSPVLDAGDPAGCFGEDGKLLASDQRGATRPVGVCDIGAVEMQ